MSSTDPFYSALMAASGQPVKPLTIRCNGQVITGGELVHPYACPMHPETTANKPGVPFGQLPKENSDAA